MNLLKIKSPVYAAMVALVFVVSQSAFKPIKANVLYGKDSSSPTGWRDLSSVGEDNTFPFAPNTYRCVESDETCTGEFDETTPPTSSNDVPTGDIHPGLFIYTPQN